MRSLSLITRVWKSQNISALLEQADEAVIVDNGSGATIKELLEKLSCHPKLSFWQKETGAVRIGFGRLDSMVNELLGEV